MMARVPTVIAFVASFVTLTAAPGSAQVTQLQKLTASPPHQGDYFAARVSIGDGVALVGDPNAEFDLPQVTGGRAHIFRYDRTNFAAEQILHAFPREKGVSFGMSVAVDGAVAVVAGYENNACTDKPLCIRAAAWVYRYNYVTRTWDEEDELLPADATTVSLNDWENQLGPFVSVSKNVIVMGVHFDASAGPNTGAAYAYRFDGRRWALEQKLLSLNPMADGWFGLEVSVSNDVAVVGAFAETVDLFQHPHTRSGTAYVFRYDGVKWNREQILVPYMDGHDNDIFGASVSVSGDVIMVGANLTDDGGVDSGAVYVFHYNKGLGIWFQAQRLKPSDSIPAQEFGRAVSLSGGVAVIGAYRDNTLGFRAGKVYVYRMVDKAWVQEAALTASDELPGDRFGRSVSVSGDLALLCAYRKDDACPGVTDPEACNSGAAYIFSIGPRQQ
jgi:FG-GAP repeat